MKLLSKIKSFFKSLFSEKQNIVNITINIPGKEIISELQKQHFINEHLH